MPLWITIYCRKPVVAVSPAELLHGISRADFWTLAEQYSIDEELVDPALEVLRIEEAADSSQYEMQLIYRAAGQRQLDIYFWTNPRRVQEEIEEVLEALTDDQMLAPSRVRDHLQNTSAVVAIELGAAQFRDMGIVFAFEVARWFAEYAEGLIKDDDDTWSCIEKGGFKPL